MVERLPQARKRHRFVSWCGEHLRPNDQLAVIVEEVNARKRIGSFCAREKRCCVEAKGLSASRIEAKEIARVRTQEEPRAARPAEVEHAVACAVDRDGWKDARQRTPVAQTGDERKAKTIAPVPSA